MSIIAGIRHQLDGNRFSSRKNSPPLPNCQKWIVLCSLLGYWVVALPSHHQDIYILCIGIILIKPSFAAIIGPIQPIDLLGIPNLRFECYLRIWCLEKPWKNMSQIDLWDQEFQKHPRSCQKLPDFGVVCQLCHVHGPFSPPDLRKS